MTAGERARVVRVARRVYDVAFALYLAGLLLWLALGLLPPLVASVGPAQDLAEQLAAGSGPLSGPAAAVLSHLPSLPEGLWVASQYLFSALNLALGVLLAVRCRHQLVPQLIAVAFIGTAGTFNAASHAVFHILGHVPLVTAVHFSFHIASGLAYVWAVLLFPDGVPPGLRGRRVWPFAAVAAAASLLIAFVCWRSSFIAHPPFFVAFFGVLVPIVGITAQSARLRSPRIPPAARQQSRLLRLALLPAFAVSLVWVGAQLLARAGSVSSGTTPGMTGMTTGMATAGAIVETVFPAVFALVPVALVVAVLRYRLWDLDLALSHTLRFTLIAGFVGAVYVAALATTGWLFRDQGWAAVIAMAVVALAVEPVRRASRRLANRVVFGQDLTPRQALATLADRLTRSTSRDELQDLVDVVVSGTRASSAGLWLVLPDRLLLAARKPPFEDDDSRRRPLSSPTLEACRETLPQRACYPVLHEGQLVAVLAVSTPHGVPLPDREVQLVTELARHAGLLVANARLASDLADELAAVRALERELRTSRRQVVTAQDAERRRLERDIHDGAQQELVAFLVQAGALRRAAAAGRAVPQEHVAALQQLLDQAGGTLRELSAGRLPPVLAEQGLAAALEDAATLDRRTGLAVEVTCDVGRLSPAVEAAAFFCCREAVQNAAKHARATRITVDGRLDGPVLALTVADDGRGFERGQVDVGRGLTNLMDRVAPLGGTASITSRPGSGTRVECRLPLTTPLRAAALQEDPALVTTR
ncbi:MAG: GAF domain-containing sensor histidine kinase [Actinomycetes bacterium]